MRRTVAGWMMVWAAVVSGSAAGPAGAEQPRAVAGIVTGGWTALGPTNLGGPVAALAIHPANGAIIFAGTNAGLLKSTNGGATWTALNDVPGAITAVLFDPADPSILYAGTGAGIWKSTDGGTSWAQLGATANADFSPVVALAAAPDGGTLLASTSTPSPAPLVSRTAHIYRSTDGGATWIRTLNISTPSGHFGDFDISVAYLSGGNAIAVRPFPFTYWSADGGASWTVASGVSCYVPPAIASSHVSPGLVYILCGADLYKSVDGGRTFLRVATSFPSGYYPMTLSLWVDPTNDAHLIAGGPRDLYRSTDGGANFTRISDATLAPASVAGGQNAIVSDPGYGTTNRRVYFATAAGIYKAEDIAAVTASGAGYTSLNTGLNIAVLYSAAGHAATGRIVAGTYSSGTIRYTPAAGLDGWARVQDGSFPPSGGGVAVDPVDGNTFYAAAGTVTRNTSGGSAPSEFIDGRFWNGTEWICKSDPASRPDMHRCPDARNGKRPIGLDPNDPDTLYVGGSENLWRTTNARTPVTATTGPVWEAVGPVAEYDPIGPPEMAFAVHPANSAIVWLGLRHELLVTTSGQSQTPSFTTVTPALPQDGDVSAIALDPANTSIAYVGYDGTSGPRLLTTTDGGATWAPAVGSGTSGLPDTAIRAITVHPSMPGWVYAGTDAGLYASEDGGATWTAAGDGPANVRVNDLSWMGRTLLAATAGRGLYRSTRPIGADANGWIDGPATGSEVERPITIVGWAINQSAFSGTGVDRVDVYAAPLDGGATVFLGEATYGLARPDVGAAFGTEFTNSGFTLTAGQSLPLGRYDVIVYAHSVSTNRLDRIATSSINAYAKTAMALDGPASGSTLTATAPFTIHGWALNTGALAGTGVDTLHVYAIPTGGAAIFLGVAAYGSARPDVGAIYGSQFTNSGFSLSAGASLPPGHYTIAVHAHDALTGTFDAMRSADIVLTAPVSTPFLYIDTPAVNATLTSAFEVGGWAIDAGAPSGTGVDAMQFYVQPQGAPAPGVFIGTGSYGWPRPDVAAIFGARFTNAGYHFTITGMSPGAFTLNVYAHSTVTNSYSIVRAVPITVSGTALMSIDAPAPEATIGASSFLVGGWSIDRTIETTALSGTGVDMLHVYAYPNPGSGEAAIFLGVATVGVARPDVGTAYGSRYGASGYEIVVDRAALGLAPGVYNIAVHSHSSVSGAFNNVAVVRITLPSTTSSLRR